MMKRMILCLLVFTTVGCRQKNDYLKNPTPADVPTLLEDLENEDQDVRLRAARALVEVEGSEATEAIPALIEGLANEYGMVRFDALDSIKQIGNPAVPALIEVMEDENEKVRELAARALNHIDPKAATEAEAKQKNVP